MKKIIIVNNNMKVGGVQKSLHNLLWSIHEQYDVTLCLFRAEGEYVSQLPSSVRIVECKSLVRFLGMSQGECKGLDKFRRAALAVLTKQFGRPVAMKVVLASQRTLPENYDCAIAFLQNGNIKNFYGGVQEFVLRRIKACKKVAFLHCDYANSGANHPANNEVLEAFDVIAACSDGCRRVFEEVMPQCREKCVTVRNCHRLDEIIAMAEKETVTYDSQKVNVVMVSRLAHEKGIERAIAAVSNAKEKGIPVVLHIVGGGPKEAELRQIVTQVGLEGQICFYGEQGNPYRYIKNADLFLLTSYHEAAPMVLEESRLLNVPILTVRTTSSEEMVTLQGCGWVCENDQLSLERAMEHVLGDMGALKKMKMELRTRCVDNSQAVEQFKKVIGG